MAVAVYLATYFDINKCSKSYYKDNKDDVYFKKFFEEDFSPQVYPHENFRQKLRNDFNLFKESCFKVENGDTNHMSKLLSIKKFFSIPWLICGDTLIN